MAHSLSLSNTGEPFQNPDVCLDTRIGHVSQSNDLWLGLCQHPIDPRQGAVLFPPIQPLRLDHEQTLRSDMENHIVAEFGELIAMRTTFWLDVDMANLRKMPLQGNK